jgi:hypothetical protein
VAHISGKFGIEYNPRQNERDSSGLGWVFALVAVVALISLIWTLVGRFRGGEEEAELAPPSEPPPAQEKKKRSSRRRQNRRLLRSLPSSPNPSLRLRRSRYKALLLSPATERCLPSVR